MYMTKIAMPTENPRPEGNRGAFRLPGAKPWGRNRAEYAAFFDLARLKPGTRILDCAAGPSSFAVEMAARGCPVIAADPIYGFTKDEIAAEVEVTRDLMMDGLRAAGGRFVWDSYGSPEALEATRLATMKHFLEDFEEAVEAGRYVAAALPRLPFADQAFELALCSHFLLLYSARFDEAFHVAAVREICRVAGEARIFPLLELEGERSVHLAAVREAFSDSGWATEVRRVDYEFQKGGNEMLRAWRGEAQASA